MCSGVRDAPLSDLGQFSPSLPFFLPFVAHMHTLLALQGHFTAVAYSLLYFRSRSHALKAALLLR
jgi:hypothetical protein